MKSNVNVEISEDLVKPIIQAKIQAAIVTEMTKGKENLLEAMVNGALTVVLHDEFKKQLSTFAPGIQMGEYIGDNELGYYGSGLTAGVMNDSYGGMGSYLPELDTDDLGMEQEGLGLYESGDPVYMEDMSYG